VKTKIVRRAVLKGILDELRQQGRRIVFTNGCFDILHVGHLRCLQEASQLGDCLVVGLNTDDSVRQIKGEGRPFVPEFERAELLAGLGCVDYVTLFAETTPTKLIAELRPDIHVKGGDYAVNQMPETEAVRSYGGEVVILPEVEGKSTTRLVETLRAGAEHVSGDRIPRPSAGRRRERAVGIIPARLAATRLPNKPLLDIAGKPMIQRVYERACEAGLLDEVLVATPDEEIRHCVESFGGKAVMTSAEHRSGTDRLAEAAQSVDAGIILNIQGDEPLLDPAAVDLLVEAIAGSAEIPMASLMCPLADEKEEADPAVVKVVTDRRGFALYFSRARIPFPRHAAPAHKHIGVYAYRREFLLTFAGLAPTPLEQTESLEQLRALEHGYRIKMVSAPDGWPASVDTPEDLEKVRRILEGKS